MVFSNLQNKFILGPILGTAGTKTASGCSFVVESWDEDMCGRVLWESPWNVFIIFPRLDLLCD